MGTPGIIIPCYESYKPSWMPFGAKRGTVLGYFRRLRRDYFDSVEVLSIRIPVPSIGTNEVRYRVGMLCAIQTLGDSRRKGKCQDQIQ